VRGAAVLLHAFESPGEYFLHILSNWCLPEAAGALSVRSMGRGTVLRGIALLLLGPNQPKNDRCLTFTIETSLARGRKTGKKRGVNARGAKSGSSFISQQRRNIAGEIVLS